MYSHDRIKAEADVTLIDDNDSYRVRSPVPVLATKGVGTGTDDHSDQEMPSDSVSQDQGECSNPFKTVFVATNLTAAQKRDHIESLKITGDSD